MKYLLSLLLIMVAGVTAVILIPYVSKHQEFMTDHTGFTPEHISLTNYNVNDLGTVDYNNDGNLDIYTTNHSAIQNLLAGDGQGDFTEKFLSSGLEQAEGFPGLGNSAQTPNMVNPGLYIFRTNKYLHLENHLPKSSAVVMGSLAVGWPLFIEKCKDCTYDLEKSKNSHGLSETTIKFTIEPGGKLLLKGVQDIIELPHNINIDNSTPSGSIFIGQQLISPPDNEFELQWRDRHGMAWFDYDRDGLLDVYIARGGVRGQAASLSSKIQDELFLQNDPHSFTRSSGEYDSLAHACPGRKVNWIDLDNDASMDLYIVCGRNKTEPHFNRVILGGKSAKKSRAFGVDNALDYNLLSQFVWLDSDNDSDYDLFSIEGDTAILHQNNSGVYVSIPINSDSISKLQTLSYTDYDNDGDTDVFLASRYKNVLFRNDNSQFIATDPADAGLPTRSHTANWVDYDNDGLKDMHSLPGGLFRQTSNGIFEKTPILAFNKPAKMKNAICSWFDANNDGLRDSVCSVQIYPHRIEAAFRKYILGDPFYTYWNTYYYLNKEGSNSWLQTRLIGPEHNSSGIGSTITLETDKDKYTAQLGESEGSHFSQGHFRNYFGLGKYKGNLDIRINWFDGKDQLVQDVAPNQLIEIRYQ